MLMPIAAPIQTVRSADGLTLGLGLDQWILTYAYSRWRGELLFPKIFPHATDMSLAEFLEWNYRPTVEPVGCFSDGGLIGIGWICQARAVPDGVAAEVGAAFFAGTPLSMWRNALRLFVRHAFVDREFSAVYGKCARDNEMATQIVKCCGMMKTGRFPWDEEVPSDVDVYVLARSEWQMRSEYGSRV